MRRYLIAAPILLCTSPALAGDTATQWILNNFAGVPTYTGGLGGRDPSGNTWTLTADALVKDAECSGGYYCIKINPKGGGQPSRVGFVNFFAHDQVVNGIYAAGIFTNRDWNETIWPNTKFDVFLSNVKIQMNLPPWQSYSTTNFDGFMGDGGRGSGGFYAEDLIIDGGPGWADGCVDFKGKEFQAVRMKCEGNGINTLKMWYEGVHYLVDSTFNNSYWATHDVELGGVQTDGGLLSTDDCTKLELRMYNTTWNGSPTLPRTKIACWTHGTPADVKLTYLTTDPRGQMHPMFGGSGTQPPVVTLSPAGTMVPPAASIQGPDGKWTLSSTGARGSDFPILLNGQNDNNGGYAALLQVGTDNKLYAKVSGGSWWRWENATWVASEAPTTPPIIIPPVADLKVVLPKTCTVELKGTVYNNAGTPAVCP